MALRNQPYLPLYVTDFMSDEKLANCSAESTGVYIRLMCILHKMEDYGAISLKAKDKQNASKISNFAAKLLRQMPYSQDVIERSLEELLDEGVITIEGDRLYQKRMVKDGELSRKRAEAAKKCGSSGACDSPTQQNDEQNASKIESKTDSKTSSKTQANSENEIEIKDEIKNTNLSQKQPSLTEERFERFWSAYPRKAGKGAARKSFLKIAPSEALFEQIMLALSKVKQSEQWRKEGGQFIPYPSTWLNQERWEDSPGDSVPPDFDPDNPYADWG